MKIAILTMFNGLSTTYSLVNVVSSHIKMMLDNDEDVTMVVTSLLNDSEKHGIFLDKRLNWIKIDNSLNGKNIRWYDYSNFDATLHNTFYDEVTHYKNEFINKLNNFDVLFMHDILYQGWHLVHNTAIREALKSISFKKIFEFTHSIPVTRTENIATPFINRYTGLENTSFLYPTNSGLESLSQQYNIPLTKCFAVNNALPIIDDLDESVQLLSTKTDLYSPEILVIYPARLTNGKKFEKITMFLGALKTISNLNVKVIFADFKSSDIDETLYKEIIIDYGIFHGLSQSDIVFTSDFGFRNGFPRKGVLDLFTLSNLFICPSFSESFGLTTIEAASRGNFVVVNKKVPALEELGTNLNLYFMNWDALNFGFKTTETYSPSEFEYYKDHAKIILDQIKNDKALCLKTKIRNQYNTNYIWQNQLKPLLYNQ